MSDRRPTHGADFQRQVIRLMMLEGGFCDRASSYLEESYFTGELKWYFRKSKSYFSDYKKTPTDEFFRHEILKHTDATEAQRYENERALICAAKPDDAYLRRELTGFIRANLFIGAYREAAALYNGGSKEDAYDFTRQKLDLLQKVDFEHERVTRFGDWEQTLDSMREQQENACPTGIAVFDESLGGGMLSQTWTTFIGSSSAGKSMAMPNLAWFNALAGKRTFITVHEDEQGPSKVRYLARFSGIRYNRLLLPRHHLAEDEITKLELADEILNKFVALRFMYGREATIEKVQDAARMLKREWDFQLFLCDYGQCLGTSAFKSRDDNYSVQGYVYEQLKQICLELNVAGAGGAQTNRVGHQVNKKGTDFLRMTDVGDSFTICKKSSNVITMNRSEEDTLQDRLVFLLDKARSGRAPIAVECLSDYSKCITHQEPHTQREIPVNAKARRGNEPAEDDV